MIKNRFALTTLCALVLLPVTSVEAGFSFGFSRHGRHGGAGFSFSIPLGHRRHAHSGCVRRSYSAPICVTPCAPRHHVRHVVCHRPVCTPCAPVAPCHRVVYEPVVIERPVRREVREVIIERPMVDEDEDDCMEDDECWGPSLFSWMPSFFCL